MLASKLNSTAVDQKVVQSTVSDPRVTNFEDGLEYYSALNSSCEFIITEDQNGFYFSKIPVLTCDQFMKEKLF